MQTKGTVQKGIFLVVAVLFLLSLIPVFAMAFYAYAFIGFVRRVGGHLDAL